jgi:glycosyltransferase involved in cell wall biosynthesis
MIGALPPLKGNAYYATRLATELSKIVSVDFISFRKLYPQFLYPGGDTDVDGDFVVEENPNLSIRRTITYYNPFSWIRAGILAKSTVVHIQWWSIPLAPIYLVILLVLKIRRKKIVFTVHNVIPHEPTFIDNFLTSNVFKFGDAFIVHSNVNIRPLSRQYHVPIEKIFQVHMPIHDMYGAERIGRNQARARLNLPSDGKVILCFGNIRNYKGVDDLILAFHEVASREPEAILLIAGQPWKSWATYEKLIFELGLGDKVKTSLGYVPMSEVKFFFESSDLVVLPYKKFDAQSGVGNTALAFGLPLVVTRTGGLPDLVKDERAVVEPKNPRALAETIVDILSDTNLHLKLRQDTKIIAAQLSWPEAARKTVNIYKSVKSIN